LPSQPISNLSPSGIMSIIYCLYFRDSPNQEGQVPVFISPQKQGSPIIPLGIGFYFKDSSISYFIPSLRAHVYAQLISFATPRHRPPYCTWLLAQQRKKWELWKSYTLQV
jgi:hypothetical protein